MEIKLYIWMMFGKPLFLNDDSYDRFYEYVFDCNRVTIFFDEDINWSFAHMDRNDKEVTTLEGTLKTKDDVRRLYRLYMFYGKDEE